MSVIADALRQAQQDDPHASAGHEDRGRPPARAIQRVGLNSHAQYGATQSKASDGRRDERSRILRGWLAMPVAICAVVAAMLGAALHPQSLVDRTPARAPAVRRAVITPAAVPRPVADELPALQVASPPAGDPVAVTPPPLSPDGYHLSGIMRTDEGLWAVINGAVVFVGDTVAGVEVVAIDTRGARIRAYGRETRLTLSGGETDAH